MMELELKKLYDTVTTVHEEMFNLRERQVLQFISSLKQLLLVFASTKPAHVFTNDDVFICVAIGKK